MLVVPSDIWSDLNATTILLAPDCSITPADLAMLLEEACFCSSDDSDADSYHTQQACFAIEARFTANNLLFGEDAALIGRVRDAVLEPVAWLIPKDRPITVVAGDRSIEVAFAANDQTTVSAAA